MDLVDTVYETTEVFPKREIYSLNDQIRGAAVSIPSNIAEGQAHFSNRQFIHFLRHSRGSRAELETQLEIARRPQYLSEEDAKKLSERIDELSRILSGLINSLKERDASKP